MSERSQALGGLMDERRYHRSREAVILMAARFISRFLSCLQTQVNDTHTQNFPEKSLNCDRQSHLRSPLISGVVRGKIEVKEGGM